MENVGSGNWEKGTKGFTTRTNGQIVSSGSGLTRSNDDEISGATLEAQIAEDVERKLEKARVAMGKRGNARGKKVKPDHVGEWGIYKRKEGNKKSLRVTFETSKFGSLNAAAPLVEDLNDWSTCQRKVAAETSKLFQSVGQKVEKVQVGRGTGPGGKRYVKVLLAKPSN